MIGKALVKHMQDAHGFVTWNPPRPGTREYENWKQDHETLYHGLLADQQDHEHMEVCR